MRKWKRGVIAVIVFFLALALFTATDNGTIRTVFAFAVVLSMLYALVLVILFLSQRMQGWSKERSKLKIEEKVIKTKVVTIYECGHCRAQYSNSQTCPKCGSPYRKTILEKTEEETVEKWKAP